MTNQPRSPRRNSSSDVEYWTSSYALPGVAAVNAATLEAEGWSGMGIVDSQCTSGDTFVAATVASVATSVLRLGTSVTNSITRHPATLASAAAALQEESGGRFVLGIGRGDSALAHLGLAPAPVAQFERFLERLQGYLAGDDVPFDLATDAVGGLRSVESLGLAGAPDASRLRWLERNATQPKVPVDVAATGPRMIKIAARLGDAITLGVGVDDDRVAWAIDLARQTREAAGLDPDTLGIGAYVPLMIDDDRVAAREALRGHVGSYARFSVMQNGTAGPIARSQSASLAAVKQSYDMRAHFKHGSPQSQAVTTEVFDAFSIAGPSDYCLDRLGKLYEMGIRRFQLMGPGAGAPDSLVADWRARIVAEILPASVN
ncbi:LLM class flavin-dependent oxidoreductase [Gordonia sp. CPCC 205333]|uniref:LLM class flavin-dependent oxidoreductase n=1 Tax=Gordonia sp. CPCC 205333 TaxID=3140790 RepID=UPI003AF3C906